MDIKNSRGSQWHKWDYHVHTPASWLYKYRGPDAIRKIAETINVSDVQAFGINDYLTIDGYLELRQLVKKPIFPVVEFRMTDILVDKKQGGPHFNFHLLFSNDDTCLPEIQAFLSALQFEDFEGVKRNLTGAEIIAFGKQVLDNETDLEKLRFAALEKIKFPFKEVIQTLQAKGLRDKCLIILPYDEHGGIDGIDPKADGLHKSGLIRHAHMIGSSAPQIREYFLGKSNRYTQEQFELWVGRPKPIIKGSDAHSPEDIGNLPKKTDGVTLHCWIKADLTFEGLKQTLYEPEERVFIGSSPPDRKDNSKVISSICIRSSNGWFKDQTLELNRDLVCIIGGKGSGKTALVDLLGLSGGDFDIKNENTFLYKAGHELAGTKLLMQWEDGSTDTELTVSDPPKVPIDRKVRYLSQSFVESLCAFDRHEQLEREIEGILFQYVPKTKALGTDSFESLKIKETEGVRLEIDNLAARIGELNEDIFTLGALIESRPQLVRERDQIEKDIAELHKQKPQPSTDEEKKNVEALALLSERRAKLASEVEGLRIKLNKLEVLKRRFGLISDSIQAFNTEVRTVLGELGESGLVEDIRIVLPERAAGLLNEKIRAIAEEVAVLEGTGGPCKEGVDTIDSLDKEIAALNQKSTTESQRKEKFEEFNRRIAENAQKRDALAQKISTIDQFTQKELDAKVEQRKQLFLSFFKKLEEKRQVLERLYGPLNEKAADTEEGAKVRFYARYTFNHERFASEAGDVFDFRKSVLRSEKAFVDEGKRFWGKIQAGLPSPDFKAIDTLLSALQKEGARPLKEQVLSNKTTKNCDDWLYSLDYYDVEYGIKYDDTDLDKLSPGKKGVVLLLIYLTIDKDYRPLIIDQPEENLDNRSVYSTLVKYFREAKKKRQVIVVTHNANLVVNGDAEQVVVANFEKDMATQSARIKYVCGALENTRVPSTTEKNVLNRQGIREHVCELLEGGETAFEKREEKYGFSR